MLFMLISRTRQDLSKDDFAELAELAKNFYANIPEEVTLHSDWAALDGSCTYALIEAADVTIVESLQAPFRAYVDIDIVPVRKLSGWEVS